MKFDWNNARFIFLPSAYYIIMPPFTVILFPCASFVRHVVTGNFKEKHKPEDNTVNCFFRKIVRAQKNMRCIYLHEVTGTQISYTVILFFLNFFFFFGFNPRLRAYTLNLVLTRHDVLKRSIIWQWTYLMTRL